MQAIKLAVSRAVRMTGFELRRAAAADDSAAYRSRYPAASIDGRRFYNIGAGGFRHPTWTNVDHRTLWYGDVQTGATLEWDLLELGPLAVETGVAEIVYSSHTIEHITNEAAANLFREAHRVLKPGGVIRLTTPDIRLDHRAYRAGDTGFFYWAEQYSRPERYEPIGVRAPMNRASAAQLFLFQFASSLSQLHVEPSPHQLDDAAIDELFTRLPFVEGMDYCRERCSLETQRKYPGNHINWWTAEKALAMLHEAGFEDAYRSGYGQSAAHVLRNTDYFDNTHPKLSLYIEARR